tara:strand:+ start:2671 stop:2910 length:240 start_codon:yes stop_codon:yes gene_type:complete
MSKLDPELRKKLLKETKAPFKGLRRLIWAACTGSAFLGIFIMGSKILAGNEIEMNNLLIQLIACLVFPTLFYLERDKSS